MDDQSPREDLPDYIRGQLENLLDSLSLLVKHCQVDEEQFVDLVRQSYQRAKIPSDAPVFDPTINPDSKEILGSILQVCFSDPRFLDDMGEPIPVPLTGPPPSLQFAYDECNRTLGRVQSTIGFDQSVYLLEGADAIQKHGDLFLPLTREFNTKLRGISNAHSQLAYVSAYLHTAAHNALVDKNQGHLQAISSNPAFPIDKVPFCTSLFSDQGNEFIRHMDAIIDEERVPASSPPEDSVHLSVGLYMSILDD